MGSLNQLDAVLDESVDFALVASRARDGWRVDPLPTHLASRLDSLIAALRSRIGAGVGHVTDLSAGSGDTIGLVSVDEDFFVILRVTDSGERMLLSDVTAAMEWPLAYDVLIQLALPLPEGEEEERVQPAGDLSILADLGVDAMALGALCDDIDLYPEEVLAEVADALGFGVEYEQAVDALLD